MNKIDKYDRVILQADPRDYADAIPDDLIFARALVNTVTKATSGSRKVTLGPIQARILAASLNKALDDAGVA